MCSFSAPRSLAEVLATFLGPGKVSGPFRRVVGRRRLLATGGLGLWLEMGVSVWRSLRYIGCLWGAFPATPLVHALINVGVGCILILPFDVVRWPFGDNAHANKGTTLVIQKRKVHTPQ